MNKTLEKTVKEIFGREISQRTKNAIESLKPEDRKMFVSLLLHSIKNYVDLKEKFESKKAIINEMFFDNETEEDAELDEVTKFFDSYISLFDSPKIEVLEREMHMLDDVLYPLTSKKKLIHYLYIDLGLLKAGLNYEERWKALHEMALDDIE